MVFTSKEDSRDFIKWFVNIKFKEKSTEFHLQYILVPVGFPYYRWTVKGGGIDEDGFIRARMEHPAMPQVNNSVQVCIDPLTALVVWYETGDAIYVLEGTGYRKKQRVA